MARRHRIHHTARLIAVAFSLTLLVFGPPGGAQTVKAVQLPGAWKITANGRNECATCDEYPLTLGLGASDRVLQGVPAEITVGLSSRIPSVLTLREPVELRVRIERGPDSGCCPVTWEGILPPLTGSIPPGSATFQFIWNQRDSSGRQVPLGYYRAAVEYPITIAYAIGGASGEERLTPVSGHILGGELSFGTIRITGVNQFSGPRGMFVDKAGRIYVADSRNNRVVRMDNMSGMGFLSLGVNRGAGIKQFAWPAGMFVEEAGRIYVADTLNDRIVRMDDMTGAGWTTFGAQGNGVGEFSRPSGIFVDNAGRIYVIDSLNERIVRVNDMTGAGWTTLDSKGPHAGELGFPAGVFVDASGRIYVVAPGHVIRMNSMAGDGWTLLGDREGTGRSVFSNPSGISVDKAGRIYVADSGNSRILRVDGMGGTVWTTFGSPGAGVNQFTDLGGIFVDEAGRIYVADSYNDRIVRVDDMTGAGWKTVGNGGNAATSSPRQTASMLSRMLNLK